MMALFEVYAEDGRPVQLDELPGVRAWNLDTDPEPMIVRNVVRATGEQRWLLSKAIAIRDPDGMPLYVVNFTEDITAAKRVELAQRVLAEAGRMLVSSLDYERTLQQVAMLAVPELADWCGVDMPGRGGFIEPVAVGHVDPERVAVARRLRERYPVRIDEADGMAAVVRGDIPYLLVDETTDEALVAYAVDDEHLELMRAVGFNAIMIVPIVGAAGIARGPHVRLGARPPVRRPRPRARGRARPAGRGRGRERAPVQRAGRHRPHAPGRARARPGPARARLGRRRAVPPRGPARPRPAATSTTWSARTTDGSS